LRHLPGLSSESVGSNRQITATQLNHPVYRSFPRKNLTLNICMTRTELRQEWKPGWL